MTDSILLCKDYRFNLVTLTSDGSSPAIGIQVEAPDARDIWFVVAPPNVRFHPKLREIVLREALARPDIDVFYGDEVAPGSPNCHERFLKPAVDIALLVADDYFGYPLVVRASAMRRLGGLRTTAHTAASFDLVLRALSAGLGVERISEVLVAHEGPRPRPKISDRRDVIDSWLAQSTPSCAVENGLVPGTLALKRQFTTFPDISLIIVCGGLRTGTEILTTDSLRLINLLGSITRADYPMDKIHVLIGDEFEEHDMLSNRSWPFDFRVVMTSNLGNTSGSCSPKMNMLWRAAQSEHIVLLNHDLLVETPGWLQALLTFSMQKSVGGVSAQVLYPDSTILHAGMPGSLFNLYANAWLDQPISVPTYSNWASVQREWSIFTSAVFATRKGVMEVVNGFDDRFGPGINHVDLCLRLRMLGYRLVYTPFAELITHNGGSRQTLPSGTELAVFLKRWREFLDQDPSYHRRLGRQSFQIQPTEQEGEWWQLGGANRKF
jgi:GT2 family glycosyltransferase